METPICKHPGFSSMNFLRYSRFAANILNGTSSFDRLQNGNYLVLGESGFTHDDLLRGHNQYVGGSLKVNGPFYRDAYTSAMPTDRFHGLQDSQRFFA